METRIVYQADQDTVEFIQTKQFEVGFYSQKCPLKSTPNEDSLGIFINDKTAVLVVADGVGGYPNGELASHLAVEKIIQSLKKSDDVDHIKPIILTAIETVNQKLIHDFVGAQTTLSVCIIQENILQSIQIGDSCSLACGQKGLLKHKTIEHSPVGFAVAAGFLKEKEALLHPERHIVSNVLGENEMHIDLGPQITLATNDTILAATDGLFDNFSTNELIEIIRKESITDVLNKLTEICQPMRDKEKLAKFNKADDLSFIVCRQI